MSDTDAPKAVVTKREGERTWRTVVPVIMTPLAQAGIRSFRTYLQSLVAFLLLGLTGKPTLESVGVIIPASDFGQIFVTAASLAMAPAVISLLQNLVEILSRLDEQFPEIRA